MARSLPVLGRLVRSVGAGLGTNLTMGLRGGVRLGTPFEERLPVDRLVLQPPPLSVTAPAKSDRASSDEQLPQLVIAEAAYAELDRPEPALFPVFDRQQFVNGFFGHVFGFPLRAEAVLLRLELSLVRFAGRLARDVGANEGHHQKKPLL